MAPSDLPRAAARQPASVMFSHVCRPTHQAMRPVPRPAPSTAAAAYLLQVAQSPHTANLQVQRRRGWAARCSRQRLLGGAGESSRSGRMARARQGRLRPPREAYQRSRAFNGRAWRPLQAHWTPLRRPRLPRRRTLRSRGRCRLQERRTSRSVPLAHLHAAIVSAAVTETMR